LGIPIKSFSLKSKTILHAIRMVAEMKLELIHLHKELSLIKAGGGALTEENQDVVTTTITPTTINNYQAFQQEDEDLLESTRTELHKIVFRLQEEPQSGDIQTLLELLMQKVEATSQQTQSKFQALQSQMDSTNSNSNNLEKKLKTRQNLHGIELQADQARHMQQVMDMSGMLESYQEQVERQQELLIETTAKYEDLASIAVTSPQAREVLEAIGTLNDPNITDERGEQVQIQVVELLKRMAIMHSRQEREMWQLELTLAGAQKKEAETESELKHLGLQMGMLSEETHAGEEWLELMNQQRLAYKQEISAIIRREEKRLLEMEYLEVRLTELSFVAVELEDSQKELKENQQVHTKEVGKAQTFQQATSQKLQALHEQVDQVMKQQAEALETLSKSTAAGAGHANTLVARPEQPEDADIQKLKGKLQDEERLHQLERQLAQRDEELLKTRQELYAQQQRVQELERGSSIFVENKPSLSDTESTGPLSQRSS
jgi:hypothetical protein